MGRVNCYYITRTLDVSLPCFSTHLIAYTWCAHPLTVLALLLCLRSIFLCGMPFFTTKVVQTLWYACSAEGCNHCICHRWDCSYPCCHRSPCSTCFQSCEFDVDLLEPMTLSLRTVWADNVELGCEVLTSGWDASQVVDAKWPKPARESKEERGKPILILDVRPGLFLLHMEG
jgi:hypothetical protein